jgi:ribonuclease P protein component
MPALKILPFKTEAEFFAFRQKARRVEGPHFALMAAGFEGWRLRVVAAKRVIGGAVERNRAKRRLRAAFRKVAEHFTGVGAVLYAKRRVLKSPFVEIVTELKEGLTHALSSGGNR